MSGQQSPSEPKGRRAAWTEERGTSDEGRRRLKAPWRRAGQQSRRAGQHSTLALALLVCGCVFAAVAGPALSLHTRSQALHQTLAGLAGTDKTVQVNGNWGDFTDTLQTAGTLPSLAVLPAGIVGQSMDQLSSGFRALGLPLAAGSWFGLSANPLPVPGATPKTNAGAIPRFEVTYRNALTSHAQLVAGSYAGTTSPPGTLLVAATTQTAALFGLHPGSHLTVASSSGPLKLIVTAIVRLRDPGSTFWAQDSAVGVPSLDYPPRGGIPYWIAGVFADPGQFAAMEVMFSGPGMDLTWEFPLSIGGVGADQVQSLYDRLNRATSGAAPLTGSLTQGASIVAVTTPLLPSLAA
ncbi:MAG: hypothetical protein ABSB76_28660, partial [Streptosporangiaceae bacterium]